MGCLVTCVGVDGEEERPEAVNKNNSKDQFRRKAGRNLSFTVNLDFFITFPLIFKSMSLSPPHL